MDITDERKARCPYRGKLKLLHRGTNLWFSTWRSVGSEYDSKDVFDLYDFGLHAMGKEWAHGIPGV